MDKKTLYKLEGKRLKECLERCSMTQLEFCKRAGNYNTSSFNQILREDKERGIPDYLLSDWSKILGVDAGYFISEERFKSYDEYKGYNHLSEDWKQKLDFLKYGDFKIVNISMTDNDEIISYNIHDQKNINNIEISAMDMQAIKSQVHNYMRFLIYESLKGGDDK